MAKQKLNIKPYLTNSEMAGFINSVVSELTQDEDLAEKYYVYADIIINKYTIATYLDETSIEMLALDDNSDYYGVVEGIKSQINMNQYTAMLARIDEGIAYELNIKAKNSLFDGMNQGNNDEMLSQLDAVIEKVGGIDKFNKLMDLATQNSMLETAREEAKAQIAESKKK
jgi:hypothetical protein